MKIINYLEYYLLFIFTALPGMSYALEAQPLQGHIKTQQQYFLSDQNSFDNFLGQAQSSQTLVDFRLIEEIQYKQWALVTHYQLNSINGSAVELTTKKNRLFSSFNSQQASSLFDLSNNIKQKNSHIIKQKLDRFYLSYSQDQLVIKIGRQALSWGNGLVFRPMDIFNPFSPDEVDSSYKSGTDMIYGQWLFDNGSDISFLMVPRRDVINRELSSELSSRAIKWHSFYGNIQTDLLLAKDYRNTIIAAGFNGPVSNAIWRTDIVQTMLNNNEKKLSLVFNLETAWQGYAKNFSGFVEYFHNGLGEKNTGYTLDEISSELNQSIFRGQLFNTGQNYLAYGLRISWTPLLQLSPLLMTNTDDHSRLFFIQGLYSYSQNTRIDFGASLSVGKQGSEFGGLETSANNGVFLQIPNQIYARLSYYF